MLETLRTGGKRALADALTRIEAAAEAAETAALLDAAFASPRGFSLGLTGPPGVGKSTLIDALIRLWRRRGRTVGVIAVDPSSGRSGGALLGDRTRLGTEPTDAGVFVRSMAARDRLGGVAETTFPAMVLMRALYDLVIVETVGVGQSETEIVEVADLVAVCAQPGSGDALQYLKAGLMEVPDLVVVTKADMGEPARRTASELGGALAAAGTDVPVLACAAMAGEGVEAVLDEAVRLAAGSAPRFAESRPAQVRRWVESQIVSRYGTEGLRLAKLEHPVDNSCGTPFSAFHARKSRVATALAASLR